MTKGSEWSGTARGARRIGLKGSRAMLLVMALCCPAGSTSAALAENLVENGEIDFDTLGWFRMDNGLTPAWLTIDHDECGSASGSARIENDLAAAGVSEQVVTCALGIVGGAPYTLQGYLRFASGQARSGNAFMAIDFFDSAADCVGNHLGGLFSTTVGSAPPDVWGESAKRDLVAPAGARSAWIRVYLKKNEAGGSLHASFDGIHLVEGNGYLFGDGFESDTLCRWSGVSP